MAAIKENPFHKPNPFKYTNVQRFQHAHLPSSDTLNSSSLYSGNTNRLKQSNISASSWQFNQNNLNRRVDFSRKYEPSSSQVSDFQIRMKVSSLYTAPNNKPRAVENKQDMLSNPFYRKNLLVSRAEVDNQVEIDINMYRKKTSSYHEGSVRMSFGEGYPTESPHLSKEQVSGKFIDEPITSRYIRPGSETQSPPLVYSKTPGSTNRQKQQDESPPSIEFRKKKFYLTPVAPDSPRF